MNVNANELDSGANGVSNTSGDTINPDNPDLSNPKPIKKIGKPKLPEGRRRVFLSVRILPATKAALERIQAENLGRAIDDLISSCLRASDGGDASDCVILDARAARSLMGIEGTIPTTRI